MGDTVIITGISQLASQAMRWLSAGPERFITAGDLQAGIEEAERVLHHVQGAATVANGELPPADADGR
jgi:hypothetical protein